MPLRESFALALLLVLAPPAHAPTWTALSRTAMSITGDVEITPGDIRFSDETFKIRLVRQLAKARLEDARRIVNFSHTPSSARLYRTAISRNAVLLNGNNICGPRDATWMLAVYAEDRLSLAFSSGEAEPNLDYQVAREGRDLCGTFSYVAARSGQMPL